MSARVTSKPVIGIVGGIGSGKTAVAFALEELGCFRIDCDKLGHALLGEKEVKHEIRELWGPAVFDDDGEVNRRAVAGTVFQHHEQLDALERILHPRIREAILSALHRAETTDGPAVVVDAAVLFEAGWDDLCTHTVFVDALEADRLARVRQDRGWDAQTLRKREACQIPLDKKAIRCSHRVRNRSSVSHLREQVRQFLHQIIHA